MKYGLIALSLAMLTGGGVAAQSALDISYSADAIVMNERHTIDPIGDNRRPQAAAKSNDQGFAAS